MIRVGATFAVFAGILACLGVVILATNFNPTPSAAQWRQEAIEASSALLPKGGRACGVVGLREDPLAVAACIKAASQNGEPFWVLSEGQGIDSHVWSLVVGSASAKMSGWDLDSYGWEERGRVSFKFVEQPCQRLAGRGVSPAEVGELPAFYCVRGDTSQVSRAK